MESGYVTKQYRKSPQNKAFLEWAKDEAFNVNKYDQQYKDKYDQFYKYGSVINTYHNIYGDGTTSLNYSSKFKEEFARPGFSAFRDRIYAQHGSYDPRNYYGDAWHNKYGERSSTFRVTGILDLLTNHERRVFQANKEALTDDQLSLLYHELQARKSNGYDPVFWEAIKLRTDVALQQYPDYVKSYKEDHKSIWDYIIPDGLTLPGSNYIGPGNTLVKGPALSEVDKIAARHDAAYAMAKTEKDIEIADAIMINDLKQLDAKGFDNVRKFIAEKGISLKALLEKKFGHKYPKLPDPEPSINTQEEVSI